MRHMWDRQNKIKIPQNIVSTLGEILPQIMSSQTIDLLLIMNLIGNMFKS